MANLLTRLFGSKKPKEIDPSEAALDLRAKGLTYLSEIKLSRIERALREAATKTPEGDFFEFGVALGGSAVLIAQNAKEASRRFAGFDVFAMIPEPTSDKDDDWSKERYEIIRSGQSEGLAGQTYYGYEPDLYGKVVATFAEHGLPLSTGAVELHKGLFEDTVPVSNTKTVAFAHVDCDWYDPVTYCLEFLAEHLVVGGLVVIDDYHDYEGCKTATDEFLAAHPEFSFEEGRNPILRKTRKA